MVFVAASMWAAVVFRYGHVDFTLGPVEIFCAVFTLLLSAIIFLRLGLYRAVIRFMGQQAIWAVITAVSYSTLVLGAAVFLTQAEVPRSMPFIYWALALLGIGGTRLGVRAYYQAKLRSLSENVIIYGAGESGRQLLTALNHGDQYRPVVFVDDDIRLQSAVINGLQVARPEEIEQLIAVHDITQILLAIPSASPERRKEIINSLVGLPVYVRTVPRIAELVAGEACVNQIQDVDLDDLLCREPVPPHPELMDRCITGKVVMVTGAAGSIGSELCRQIVQLSPRVLILFEQHEYSLYALSKELENSEVEVISILGSVVDQSRVRRVVKRYQVDTIYHAAAYKHVPMLEDKVREAVRNNIIGSWNVARLADRFGCSDFVMVSTDKAVNPGNIMGATKRVAEIICQTLDERSTTRFITHNDNPR